MLSVTVRHMSVVKYETTISRDSHAPRDTSVCALECKSVKPGVPYVAHFLQIREEKKTSANAARDSVRG